MSGGDKTQGQGESQGPGRSQYIRKARTKEEGKGLKEEVYSGIGSSAKVPGFLGPGKSEQQPMLIEAQFQRVLLRKEMGILWNTEREPRRNSAKMVGGRHRKKKKIQI